MSAPRRGRGHLFSAEIRERLVLALIIVASLIVSFGGLGLARSLNLIH